MANNSYQRFYRTNQLDESNHESFFQHYPYFLNDPNFARYQKRCRKIRQPRTIFTKLQLAKLNKAFETSTYLSSKERKVISKDLHLTQTQVKTWFQNKRSKEKKLAANSLINQQNQIISLDESFNSSVNGIQHSS